MTYNIAILGASGYTGAELIRLIAGHSHLKIRALGAHSKAGLPVASVFPHLRHLQLPDFCTLDQISWDGIDLCFCALPHQTTQSVIPHLPDQLRIIDLSADFRLQDPEAYLKWYGAEHGAQTLQTKAVCGLTEFYRSNITNARLVAGTGCNAAAGQFALRPLVETGVVDLDEIILDLKAGVSGSGRALKEHLLHAELSEGYQAYSLGGTHRHLGEFDQELSKVAGRPVHVQFSPHLIPANRGILMTCYVKGDATQIHACLAQAYEKEPFLIVLPFGETPSTRHVRGSNFCHIGIVPDRGQGRAVVVSVLDNLTKGSSGQALQNANLMLGIPEITGLMMPAMFP